MKTEILPADSRSIRKAADLLLAGELVAIPTETVYGLAAIGTDPDAVQKIFAAKGRPSTDPLILHLPSPNLHNAIHAGILAQPIPDAAFKLTAAFWPGPLTLILHRGPKVPDPVTSGLPTVAVRYPSHPVTQKLLAQLAIPLAAPSANRFGRISPTDASAVLGELDGRIPLILDGGNCLTGVESTVISLVTKDPTIFRPGKISPADISPVLGQQPALASKTIRPDQSMPSPGMLESHYAPLTPLYLTDQSIMKFPKDFQFIHYHSSEFNLPTNRYILTPKGDPETAAKNLYRILRNADAQRSQAILVEPIPDSNLAPAMRDRLQRACSGTASWDGQKWVLHPKNS